MIDELAASDGFVRAVLSDRDRSLRALDALPAPREHEGRAARLIEDVYARLRSPIHPRETGGAAVVHGLVAALWHGVPVTLRAVLAAPTARRELPFFLRLAGLLRRDVPVRLQLVHVRWPTLAEPLDDRTFREASAAIRASLVDAGWLEEALEVADIRVLRDRCVPQVVGLPEFERASGAVAAALGGRGADSRLRRDLEWSVAFYRRQRSLNALGPGQAYVDLAIRRALGRRLSRRPTDGGTAVIVTSELHRRMLPCYGATVPIVNIDLSADRDDCPQVCGGLAGSGPAVRSL